MLRDFKNHTLELAELKLGLFNLLQLNKSLFQVGFAEFAIYYSASPVNPTKKNTALHYSHLKSSSKIFTLAFFGVVHLIVIDASSRSSFRLDVFTKFVQKILS